MGAWVKPSALFYLALPDKKGQTTSAGGEECTGSMHKKGFRNETLLKVFGIL